MSTQFCSNCGDKIPLNSKFCTSCGHQVHPSQTDSNQNQAQQHVHTANKPNNNKWFLLGAVAIIAIIAFFIFNKEDTPEQVAEKFVDHMSTYEIGKVKELLARDADEYLKEEIDWMLSEIKSNPDAIKELKNEAKEHGYEVTSFKVTNVDKSEDYASVYIELTYNDGDTEDIYVDLLKENGKWKIEDSY